MTRPRSFEHHMMPHRDDATHPRELPDDVSFDEGVAQLAARLHLRERGFTQPTEE